MKKYIHLKGILFFVFVLISQTGQSQILISLLLGDKLNSDKLEFGLDGGLNYSTITGLDNADPKPGFNLGFYFDIKLKNPNWKFNTGVIVKSPSGAKNLPVYSLGDAFLDSSFAGGNVTRKLRYFNVPVAVKYTFKNNMYLKGGFVLGLRSKCIDEFKNTVNNDDIILTKKIKQNYHLIDAGAVIGFGYRLMKGNGMNIGIQYHQGFLDITKDNSSSSQFNSVVYLNLGIPIGKGKAEKKQNQNK